MFLIVEQLPGCLYSQLNISDPLSIDGYCGTTCSNNTVVFYICIQPRCDPLVNASCVATCIAQDTWNQTCTHHGE